MIDTFNGAIKDAVAMYLPASYDWRLYKAQLWQESRLRVDAVSLAGAVGIAQFMSPTWKDEVEALGFPSNAPRTDPHYAIPAGAHYMRAQYDFWSWERPGMDRLALALASYNAGAGSLAQAQDLSGGALLYKNIVKHLPEVTGTLNAKETSDYVDYVFGFWISEVTS